METNEKRTLADLPPGRRGIVKAVEGRGIIRRRLLDLGLTPGAVVEAIRKSPAGDPVAYEIRGAVVALRLEEGENVSVQEL